MKLKPIVLAMSLLSLPAWAQTTWETTEYYKSRTLAPIKASTAYSRGYTGKGSIIAILDSGIDIKSADFQNGKIIAVRDFTGSGTINDTNTYGHGTHVAGIAAGAKNNIGIQGVAFDANLLIGKTSASNGYVAWANLMPAIQWANNNNATVANISANSTILQADLKAKLIAPGVYTTIYTNTGVLPGFVGNATQWASLMPGNMVVVVAAGNDSTPWGGGLATLATAVDAKGSLLLGGRMIIAGNWNEQSNTGVGPGNNGAATLCMVFANGACQDKYRASDFYLLAPGTGIASTVPTTVNQTGLVNMTGTSMAAPAISGGVAIIRQMWPQMTGANIVKLLLVTANKNLPGYNVVTMGQGMMDLDKATRPIGNLGIPTTGRLSGATVSNVAPILVTSGSAGTGKSSSLMVLDTFQRDFYVNSKVLTGYNKPNYFNAVQASMPYSTQNNYALFNNYTDQNRVTADNIEVAMYKDTNGMPGMIEVAVNQSIGDTKIRYSTGMFSEANTWLGNSVAGFSSQGNNTASTTQFFGVGASQEFSGTKVYASAQHGITVTRAGSDNIKNISPALSYTWTLGAEHKLDSKNTFGMMIYQPVSVYHAQADITAPVGLDSEFNVIQQHRGSLAADVREVRAGMYYKFAEKNSTNITAFLENRQNFRGQEGVKDHALGIVINQRF